MNCKPRCEQQDILYDQTADALICCQCGAVKRTFKSDGRSRRMPDPPEWTNADQRAADEVDQRLEDDLKRTLLKMRRKLDEPTPEPRGPSRSSG